MEQEINLTSSLPSLSLMSPLFTQFIGLVNQSKDMFTAAFFLIILTSLILIGQRQIWIQADICASLMFGGVHMIFAEKYLQFFINGQVDDKIALLIRIYGCAIVGTLPVWYRTLNTKDGFVHISLMCARFMSASLSLLCQICIICLTSQCIECNGDISWNKLKIVYYGMVGTGSWAFGNGYFLLTSTDFGMYPQHNTTINRLLRIDAWLGMLSALILTAFPEVFLRHLFSPVFHMTCVHAHIVRSTGAILINHSLLALQAPGFLHDADKKAYFEGRLVSYALFFAPLIYNTIMLDEITLPKLEILMLITIGIPVCAIFALLEGRPFSSTPLVCTSGTPIDNVMSETSEQENLKN